jgi:hypothetical protein
MVRDLVENLKRKILSVVSPERENPEDPDEPFAMVGARVKPRRPLNRSSIALNPEP